MKTAGENETSELRCWFSNLLEPEAFLEHIYIYMCVCVVKSIIIAVFGTYYFDMLMPCSGHS